MRFFILVIIYLFGAIGAKLVQNKEKPLHFCKGFFSLISVWWSLRDSNPLPPACKLCDPCFSSSQVNRSPEIEGNLDSP